MPPTQAQLDALIDRLKADIDKLFAPVVVTTPPPTTVALGADLQLAIDQAQPGTALKLVSGYATGKPIVITKPLAIWCDALNTTRPFLRGGLTVAAPNVTLSNFAVAKDQARDDVVVLTGDAATLANLYVTGDPVRGQKRGIQANARNQTLSHVIVDHIWLPDQDSQALCGWDNAIDLVAEDCLFSAAGETVLVGGADAASITRQPANWRLSRCTLTKDLAWRTSGVQVKTTLELKNIVGFRIEDSVIEHTWQSAQDGFLITLSPRNQDGSNPWACVRGATIKNCKGGGASAFLNLLATDNERPSGLLSGVVIDGWKTLEPFDPSVWRAGSEWGTDKLIQIGGGPADVTLNGNVFTGAHLGSELYFYGAPRLTRFQYTNNHVPATTYGIMGADSSPDTAWSDYVEANGLNTGNVRV